MNTMLEGKRIGLLTASASRLGAGVAEAVIAQAALIRNLGGTPTIFALRDEFSEADKDRFAPGEVVFCKVQGPAQIGYSPTLIDSLLAAKLDCLHMQGIWMYPSRAGAIWTKKTGRPYIITPQGMLDPWITARGQWKKALAKVGYERDSWRRAYAFHALSDREAQDIARETGRTDSIVIPNPGPAAQPPPSEKPTSDFVFISRIHPKKNFLALIDAWKMLNPKCGARLLIAGWGDPEHIGALNWAMETAPPSVTFLGAVYGEQKQRLLESALFAVLPSHSEGQPFSILEAWAAATPTVMTRECNLPQGFEHGASIECGFDSHSIMLALVKALNLSADEWFAMARAANALATGAFSLATIADRWGRAYLDAIGNRPHQRYG